MTGGDVTAAELHRCFPGASLLVVPQDVLPDGVRHPELRRLLCDVGVPEGFADVVEFNVDLPEQIETVGHTYARHRSPRPNGAGDLYFIGSVGETLLCVDGETGAVFQVSDDAVVPLASGLGEFFRVLCFIAGEVAKVGRMRASGEASRLRKGLLQKRRRIDPGVAEGGEAAWIKVLDLVLAGQ